MSWVIMGKLPETPAEEIDECDDRTGALLLLREYRLAFGLAWRLWLKRRR